MIKFSEKRSGIDLYNDFYAASILWKNESQNFFMAELLSKVKDKILLDIKRCVTLELRHVWHCTLSGKDVSDYIYIHGKVGSTYDYLNKMCRFSEKRAKKFFSKKENKNILYRGKDCFFNLDWYPQYGGKKWGEICQAAIQLESCDINEKDGESLRDCMVAIDHLIDIVHNTGYCLDKIYGEKIGKFLDFKNNASQDDIIKRSQKGVKMLRGLLR